MCNLRANENTDCKGDDTGANPCHNGKTAGTLGNLDSSCTDTPCNRISCGGLSYTHYQNKAYINNKILPGDSRSWTFSFGGIYAGGNYLGKSICLFNFNQIWTVNTASSPDVQIKAYLNGSEINTYYLSKDNERGMFPSHDLATYPYYNDLGTNTVTLTNNSSATIQMSSDGIDVYRIYRTVKIC
jgi:hypothetical protein